MLALSGCTLQSVVDILATSSIGCENWTLTPTSPSGTGGTEGDGITYHAQVLDGASTVLYVGAEYDTFTTDGTPQVAEYTAAPTANPIIAGIYSSNLLSNLDLRAEYVANCPGLPIAAKATLAPNAAPVSSSLPTFDLVFPTAVTGLDVSDLVLGGTAGPTGATITAYIPEQYWTLPAPTDTISAIMYFHQTRYRVAITGVANDGSVTLSLPADAVSAAGSDGSIATGTVSATVDTTVPVVEPVGDITRQLTPGETSAAISWDAPDASDASAITAEGCLPASGSAFAPGDTTVTCSATDAAGNTGSTSFVVSVLAAQTPTVQFAQSAGATKQGGTATFAVTATDHTGTTAPLPAADYTVTSSVATDEITTSDGEFTVRFPHASPHTLTVTQLSTGATSQLTVQVTPAAVVPAAADPGPTLSATGADPLPGLALGMVLLTLGGAAVAATVARRRPRAAR